MMGKKSSKLKRFSKSYYQEESRQESKGSLDSMQRYRRVHEGAVSTASAFQSGHCVSGGEDGKLAIFDPSSGQVSGAWSGHCRGITKVLCHQNNGQNFIFSSSRDKAVKQWRFGADAIVQSFNGHSLVVSAIACSPDASLLFSGSRDNSVILWDIKSGQLIRSTSLPRNIVTDMVWCTGTNLCAQCGEDKMIRMWDSRTVAVAKSFAMKQYFQTCIDCSADGSYLATGSTGFNGSGCEVLLWDVRQGKVLHEFKGHSQKVTCCRFGNPFDSSSAWVFTVSGDSTIRGWKPGHQDSVIFEVISASRELTCLTFAGRRRLVVGTLDIGAFHLQIEGGEENPSLVKLAHFC